MLNALDHGAPGFRGRPAAASDFVRIVTAEFSAAGATFGVHADESLLRSNDGAAEACLQQRPLLAGRRNARPAQGG